MKNLIIIGVALLLVVSCTQPQIEEKVATIENSSTDSVRLAIEEAFAIHIAAGISGNAIEAISIFDDDATFFEYGSPPIVGREALEGYEINMFEQVKILKSSQTIEGLTIQGDFAYQLGKTSSKIQMKADDSIIETTARYMASWKKQEDGTWRIHYFVYYP